MVNISAQDTIFGQTNATSPNMMNLKITLFTLALFVGLSSISGQCNFTLTIGQDPAAPVCGVNPTLTANVPNAGNNPFAYTVSPVPNAFVACGANPGPTGDDATNGPNNIGFSFVWGGTAYTQFGISTNGNIQLGGGPYQANFGNTPIPAAGINNPMIAIAWDDLFADAGDITWGTFGVAPNRTLVVCFNNLAHLGGAANGQIGQGQIILYEGTNYVDIFLQTTNNFLSATQGFQFNNATGQTLQDGTWGANGGVRLMPPTPYTFAWNNGATTQSITVAQNGTYTVTATDPNNVSCTASQTVTINPGLAVNITAPPGNLCGGQNVPLTANPIGGTGAVTFVWSTGTTGASYLVTADGEYVVTATDAAGCTAADTIEISVTPLSVFIEQNPQVACGTDPIDLTAVTFGGVGGGNACNGNIFYLRSQQGEPWGSQSNVQAMDAAFGAGAWTPAFFETAAAATIFSPNTCMVFLDGSDFGAQELQAFMTANQALMESWVNAGGRMFINAAPNEGANQNWGFGGVTLNYNGGTTLSPPGNATALAHPIYQGPFLPISPTYTGNYFGHAHITGGGITTLMTEVNNQAIIAELTFGNGLVMFGGMTTSNFHTPALESQNLRQNILNYLYNTQLSSMQYLWNTGEVTPTITVNQSGTYAVLVSDANGCTASAELIVNINPPVTVNITGNAGACNGNALLTANGAGGTGGLQYLWNNGTVAPSITITQTGVYNVTAADAVGCTATATLQFTVAPPPVPTIVQDPPGLICGAQVNLTAEVANAGNDPFDYTVSPVPNAFVPCGNNPGPTGDDAVNGPHNIGFNFEWGGTVYTQFGISTNGNIQLGGGPFNATFVNAPMPAAAINNPMIAIAWDDMFADAGDITWGLFGAPGSQTLVICFNNLTHLGGAANGQIGQGQIILYEGTNVVDIFTQTTNNFVGATQGFQFNGTNGQTLQDGAWGANGGVRISPPVQYTYAWTGGQTTESINATQNGVYTVTVTDPSGCTGTATTTLNFNPALDVDITAPGAQLCGAPSVDLTATTTGGTAPFTFAWTNGATTVVNTVTISGDYVVTATDAAGCTASDTIEVSLDSLEVIIEQNPLFACGAVDVDLTAIATGGVGGGNVCNGDVHYLRSQGGEPWGSQINVQAMDAVYGAGGWNLGFFETVTAASIFSGNSCIVFMDGSDGGACELNTFMTANQALIESWVSNGGRLFLNSAPNECGNQNWGFGGVTLNYNGNTQLSNTGTAVLPTHPVFVGPYVPTALNITGNYFSHANITGGGIVPIMNDATGQANMAELEFGNGLIIFGGMTTTNFHTPSAESQNVRQNILAYLQQATLSGYQYLWNTGEVTQVITINQSGTYAVLVSDANGCTASAEINVTINPALQVELSAPLDSLCGAVTVPITATPAGGTGAVTYVWNNGVTGQVLTADSTFAYVVTATDAVGCTASDTIEVSLDPLEVTIDQNPLVACGTADVTLTANATGGVGGGAFCNGTAYYVRSQQGEPWGHQNNVQAMDAVFGPGSWQSAFLETAGAQSIFNGGTCAVFLEGSDFGACELETFLAANQALIESWVTNGGRLFLNAAPNECSNQNWGFGGVTLNYGGNSLTPSGTVVLPTHPIFVGPYTPVAANFTGNFFNHAFVTGAGITPLINDANGQPACAELLFGNGLVVFGGMTTPDWQTPAPDVQNLRQNILAYLLNAPLSGYQYLWNTGEVTQEITVNQAGIYAVLVSDANGCTASAQIEVLFNPAVTVTAAALIQPCADTALLNAQAAGGTGNFTFEWSDNQTAQTIVVGDNGTFSVTVTDALGCTAADTVVVQLGAPDVDITTDPPSGGCGVSEVTLIAGANGGGGGGGICNGQVYYLRSVGGQPWGVNENELALNDVVGPGAWTQEFFETGNAAQIFSPTTCMVFLEGGDASACELVAFMQANIGAIQNWVTAGGRIFINAAPNECGNQNWGFGGVTMNYNGGTTLSTPGDAVLPTHPIFQGPFVPVVLNYTGNYFSHANITGGGVTPIINDQNLLPSLAELAYGGGIAMFGGITTPNFHTPTLEAQNLRRNILEYLYNANLTAYNYQWNTGDTTQTIDITVSGTYSVTVTDGNGCSSADTITINFTPAVTVNILDNIAACVTSDTISAVFGGGTPGVTFEWNTGETGTTILVGADGTYSVTVTDAAGCTAADTSIITLLPPPTVNITTNPAQITCLTDSVTLTANATGGGNDPYDYTRIFIQQAFSPCGANAGPTGDDAVSGPFNIGFPFEWGGTNYTQFGISTNGNIQLGPGPYTATFFNGPMPNPAFTNPTIALAWDDMFADPGDITWGLFGAAPNRRLVVCFNNFANLGGALNGQIGQGQLVLYEGTNYLDILTQTTNNFLDATQGIQFTPTEGITIQIGAWGANNAMRWLPPTPITYDWGQGQTGQTLTVGQPGTYTVTVTDGNGCTATSNVAVNFGPTLDLGPDLAVCLNTPINLNANVTGGNGNVAYQWSTGATTQTLSFVATLDQTISCTITDASGCTATDQMVLTIQNGLIVLAGPDTVYCSPNGLVTLFATTNTGIGPYTFQWDNNLPATANPQVTVNGAATYNVTITDAFGCSGTDVAQVTVNQPPVLSTLSQDAQCGQSCDGAATAVVVGGSQPYNAFTWTDAQGTVVQTGPSDAVSGLCAGTYTLVVTDNANCSDTATFTIAEPTALSVTLGTQPSTCGASNGTVVATTTGGTGAYSYDWTPSGNNDTLTNVPAGDYTVTVSDANNCSATATATVTTTSSIVISGTATDVECFGGSDGSIATTITPGGGTFTYAWTGNATGANPTGLTAGTYVVIATDANGCSATDTIVVNDGILVIVDAGFDQTVNDGDTVTLTANSPQQGTYAWTGPNGFSETGISVTDIPTLASNTYEVVLSVGNCTGSDTVNVQVIFGAGLAMPNAFTPNGDNRNDVLLPLVSPGNDIILFQVFNRWGTRVYDLNDNNAQGWDGSYNGEAQPRDAYIWIVRTRNGNGLEQELTGDVTLIR